jgi:sensor histidine kinase YesM
VVVWIDVVIKEFSAMRRIMATVMVAMMAVLIGINFVYYFTTRDTLITSQKERILEALTRVGASIENVRASEKFYDIMLSEKLRMASIAAQYALPHQAEDVTNEQLVEIRNKLGIEGITLFTYIDNEVTGYKSSDPEEIGMKTISWSDGLWHSMFDQLLQNHDVELVEHFGEKLKNYWGGPIDTSYSMPDKISKWGYYNDGTTDYLIDPYVSDSSFTEFQNYAGVNYTINKLIDTNPYITQISVINEKVLGEGQEIQRKGTVWISDKLVTYGTYSLQSSSDKESIQLALDNKKMVYNVVEIDGKKYLNSYAPISFKKYIEDNLVVIISSDYSIIQSSLNAQILRIAIVSLICLLVGFIIVLLITRYIRKQGMVVLHVQDVYSENLDSLFNTIKEYRHDFNNHLFMLSGLASMKKYDELTSYIKGLTKSQSSITDIINVNIPAFYGLLQAKTAYAAEKGIDLKYHFEGFEEVRLDMMKITDLVRVVGNIIDNAFHAVEDMDSLDKQVVFLATASNGQLTFSIRNNGNPIPEEHLGLIFEHGFTTREDQSGSGIGLAVCSRVIHQYKGEIKVKSDPDWTEFTVIFPLHGMVS